MPKQNTSLLKKMIIKAIIRGDLTVVKELIADGIDVNTVDNETQTLLMLAISSQSLDITEFLIKSGADVNKYGKYHLTPLHLISNDVLLQNIKWRKIVKLLIKSGADINFLDKWHVTALSRAVWNKEFKTSCLLLKLGANPNIADSYGTYPLHFTATLKDITTMKLLIKYGADIYVKDSKNITPLEYLKKGDIDNYQTHERNLINLVKLVQGRRLKNEDGKKTVQTDYDFNI